MKYEALAGPFKSDPFSSGLITSSLHTVPKKGSKTDARRIVLDLSCPPQHSVNDGIPKTTYINEDFHLEYPTVDRLAELLIEKQGKNGA